MIMYTDSVYVGSNDVHYHYPSFYTTNIVFLIKKIKTIKFVNCLRFTYKAHYATGVQMMDNESWVIGLPGIVISLRSSVSLYILSFKSSSIPVFSM